MVTERTSDFGRLLAEARQGSEQALGELLDRYRSYLWVIANDQIGADLGAKVAASDIVQETYVNTHRAFPGFRGKSEEELKSWLRTSLLNHVSDAVRMYHGSQKRDLKREQLNRRGDSGFGFSILSGVHRTDSTPSSNMIRSEQIAALRLALANLPTDQREIVVRRSIQKESYASIGESLNRSPDAVRMVWRRAFRKLFEQMTSQNV